MCPQFSRALTSRLVLYLDGIREVLGIDGNRSDETGGRSTSSKKVSRACVSIPQSQIAPANVGSMVEKAW